LWWSHWWDGHDDDDVGGWVSKSAAMDKVNLSKERGEAQLALEELVLFALITFYV
jgi:hypothetical protein